MGIIEKEIVQCLLTAHKLVFLKSKDFFYIQDVRRGPISTLKDILVKNTSKKYSLALAYTPTKIQTPR